jgi:hypothetical protein
MRIEPLLFVLVCACGYHPVYGSQAPMRLHVKVTRTLVPDAVAADEVASGMRDELAREGALDGGDGWPRAEVEVLRADDSSEGIAVRSGAPAARAEEVSIVARAWITPEPGASPEHDTGDMRAAVVAAVDESTCGAFDLRASGFHHADALRAAARRLGQKLARKLIGHPATSEDTLDR